MRATDELNETLPANLPPDADYESYSALFRENRLLRGVAVVLGLGFAFAEASAFQFSHRKPVILVTRVNEIGQAQAIKYTSTEFTPDDAVVRSALYSWAKLRFTLNKETAGRDYIHNYYFLSDKLGLAGMEQDRASQKIAKVIAGQGIGNEIEILGVQIQNLNTETDASGRIAQGNAVIDLMKIFPAATNAEAHKEHWTISVNFYINPQQGAERYANDPVFQMVNPLGVTITFIHEDRAA